jgi:hypothetical protein
MKMGQSVPKRRNIKFRRRGITQKKAYNKPDFVYTVIIRACLCVENPFHNKIENCWYFKSASLVGRGRYATVFGGKLSILLLTKQNIGLFKTTYRTSRQI